MPSCSSATTRCISLFIGSDALSTTTASAPAKLCPERRADAITCSASGSCSAKRLRRSCERPEHPLAREVRDGEREERPPERARDRVDEEERQPGRRERSGDDPLGFDLDVGDLERLLEPRPRPSVCDSASSSAAAAWSLVALEVADRDELGHARRQAAPLGLQEPDHEKRDDRLLREARARSS